MSDPKPQLKRGEARATYREGDRLGTYIIRHFIASGGMGELYKAWDPHLDRPVAIKTLLSTSKGFAADPMFFTRFREEAKTIANLHNDNIVKVHAVGETEDHRPYIVMEFYEGEDLAERLTRARDVDKSPVPVQEAVQILLGASRGVHGCHLAGIVHRDLKPGNIFLTFNQATGKLLVKVLDFGVARRPHRDHQEATLDGLIIGTAHFMSPEQARAQPADARSDQYSLGALLYTMLTLHTPYDHVVSGLPSHEETASARLRAIREGRPIPPLRHYSPATPAPLEGAILRAMAFEPDDRFPTVYEFSQALLPYASVETRNYYLATYFNEPQLRIILPQLTTPLSALEHRPPKEAIPLTSPILAGGGIQGLPGGDSKKITTAFPNNYRVPTALRPPPSELLRAATSREQSPYGDGSPTEVRGPTESMLMPFNPPAVVVPPDSPSGPIPPAGESTINSKFRTPLLLTASAALALIVTLSSVTIMRNAKEPKSRSASMPATLFPASPQSAAPRLPKPQGLEAAASPQPIIHTEVQAVQRAVEPSSLSLSPKPVSDIVRSPVSPRHHRLSRRIPGWARRASRNQNGWLVARDPSGRLWMVDEKTGQPTVEIDSHGLPLLR